MGGKGKKKGGKGKKGAEDGEMDPGKLTGILQAQVDTLAQRICNEQERFDRAEDRIEQSRTEGTEMTERMQTHDKDAKNKIQAMTSMYREMEQTSMKDIDDLDMEIEKLEDKKRNL